MAIIVEDDKSKTNYGRLFGWIAVIIVLGIAIYYIFFAAPQLVVIPPPAGFSTITPLSQTPLHPEDVLKSSAFATLQEPSFPLPTSTGPTAVGRPDPFVPF